MPAEAALLLIYYSKIPLEHFKSLREGKGSVGNVTDVPNPACMSRRSPAHRNGELVRAQVYISFCLIYQHAMLRIS